MALIRKKKFEFEFYELHVHRFLQENKIYIENMQHII